MKRDTEQLTTQTFDLLVIGAGIYGAFVAWDAALRGLSVALIERDDFGHATSANSLKTLHGGLRYLQDGNLQLVRTMVHERRALMRIAPHLVHPLSCLMPTSAKLMRSKPVMGTALLLNDLLSFDRNRQLPDQGKHLPRGRIISRQQCLQQVPGIADHDLTGAAIWHDAQVYNTERFTLSLVLSAARQGASVANYVEAIEFLGTDERITGVKIQDKLTGNEFEVRAKVIVNSAGPWVQRILDFSGDEQTATKFRPSIAINLVTRQILPDRAIAVNSRYTTTDAAGTPTEKSQALFIVPWRDYSLVGTKHFTFEGQIDHYRPSADTIQAFVDEINKAYPGAELAQEDIYLIHSGFLPDESTNGAQDVKLVRESQIIDHQDRGGVSGLISIVGVKYTTARHAAEKAVNLVFRKLGMSTPPCQSALTPVYGGQIERLDEYIAQQVARRPKALDEQTLKHLIYNYGSEYHQLLGYLDDKTGGAEPICEGSSVTKAEVVHAIREEMATKLADVIIRRTELGSAGKPSSACIENCAQVMANELAWNQEQLRQEIEQVDAYYAKRTLC